MYLFTLDSHDLYGPFPDRGCAHRWAKAASQQSYTLLSDDERVRTLRQYDIQKPYVLAHDGLFAVTP